MYDQYYYAPPRKQKKPQRIHYARPMTPIQEIKGFKKKIAPSIKVGKAIYRYAAPSKRLERKVKKMRREVKGLREIQALREEKIELEARKRELRKREPPGAPKRVARRVVRRLKQRKSIYAKPSIAGRIWEKLKGKKSIYR